MGDLSDKEGTEKAQADGTSDENVGLAELLEGDPPATDEASTKSTLAVERLPADTHWPNRLQELLIASAGATGATITATMLAGSGSDVETLERLAVLFCALAALSTWFLPLPQSNPRKIRIGTWAAVAVVLYWLGPIRIAEVRAEHDLSHGTRAEKEAALVRLVRFGQRNLTNADLRELNLSDADLTNLNLRGVNLSHSSLERALLLESDLREGDLRGANFRGANLSSAKLEGAKLGKGTDQARCDRFTQLPKTFECLHGSIAPKTAALEKASAPK